MRLRNEKTYWGSIYREEEIASFNYDLLRFQFDEIYGLKKELNEKIGYTDFDSFVSKMGLKDKFLALDSRLYDEALAEFTMRYVDDGHTTYNARSLYSDSPDVDDASSLANTYIGPRRFTLLSTLKELRELRSEALSGAEPQGLFMEGKTAVIRFDAFLHAMGGYIKRMPDTLKVATPSLLADASTPFMFLKSFELIKKNPDIENVVLDLTCNGGGMVMAVPFLAAHFSDDPTIVQHDVAMNVVKEYHYKVDLNQNGVYGDEGDTYKGKYNFFLLTSGFSFSCGSLLPAIAHDAGVKLIGEKGGGGACTVGGFADASGSIYNSSSPAQSCYHDKDDKLINNDDGVPVDYPLDRDSWYDLVKLNEFVSNLSN
ncbi:MAG: hypothetical protein II467_06525 [Bacilli bacterium]|nr:hypothetical protein [Bacilli bacterium]